MRVGFGRVDAENEGYIYIAASVFASVVDLAVDHSLLDERYSHEGFVCGRHHGSFTANSFYSSRRFRTLSQPCGMWCPWLMEMYDWDKAGSILQDMQDAIFQGYLYVFELLQLFKKQRFRCTV
jgi:hypothetical protein